MTVDKISDHIHVVLPPSTKFGNWDVFFKKGLHEI